MCWGSSNSEARCLGHISIFSSFQALLVLLGNSSQHLCEQSNLTSVDHPGYRKAARERVCHNDKKLQSSKLSVMQHKILPVRAETVHQAEAGSLCAERPLATFGDNVARI